MFKGLASLFVWVVLITSSLAATGWSDGGQWESHMMGATIRGHVEHRGNDIRGVVYIYPPFGKKRTYHFTGKVSGDRVSGFHTDGHRFQGRFISPQQVEGILTTKNGRRIPVTMSRR